MVTACRSPTAGRASIVSLAMCTGDGTGGSTAACRDEESLRHSACRTPTAGRASTVSLAMCTGDGKGGSTAACRDEEWLRHSACRTPTAGRASTVSLAMCTGDGTGGSPAACRHEESLRHSARRTLTAGGLSHFAGTRTGRRSKLVATRSRSAASRRGFRVRADAQLCLSTTARANVADAFRSDATHVR
jgi:hypothetical protein